MKISKLFLFVIIALCFANLLNAQNCSDFGEGDFMDLCVSQMGDGSSGPAMSDVLELDPSNGTGGDVQLTLEAVVCNAGCGVGGPYDIGACIGGGGALGTSSDFATDFNNTGSGTPATTCNNAGGYVCVTIDFLNGFSSTAAGFDLAQSSNNGTSEGYEGSFGYVTAGTDANGNPITLPAITMANFCNYTIADYAAGTSVSTFLGVTGPGTYQTDDLNAVAATCGAEGQNGEDSDSAAGATNGTSAAGANANLGLNPTDIITQVKHIYFYSSTPGADCNGDGQSGANSNPSGSWSDVDFCFAPPCGYTLDPADIIITESCGIYSIEFANLMATGGADPIDPTNTYTVLIDGVSIATGLDAGTLVTTDITANITPGTPFTLTIQNDADTTCSTDLMLTPPPATTPNVPAFVPCTTGTTGIGG